jgi:hypothetical protein
MFARWTAHGLMALGLLGAACSTTPPPESLRASFVQQLAANRFVTNLQQTQDEVRFSAPGPEGRDSAAWRVHLDATEIAASDDPAHPFKGVVRSSWFADGQMVRARGSQSNLPLELTSNGLAQECWALWDGGAKRWTWE